MHPQEILRIQVIGWIGMVMGGPWKDQRLPTPDSRLWFAAPHLTTTAKVWATRNARPLWPASFDHTLHLFKEANVDAEDLQALLNKIEYNPVFTARPTKARRREVLTCLHRIFLLCSNREDPQLNPAQKVEVEKEVEAEIQILWRTDEVHTKKPTVLEEIITGLDYFRYSLFEAICTTYRYVENSLNVSTELLLETAIMAALLAS